MFKMRKSWINFSYEEKVKPELSQTQTTFDRKKCLADLFVRLPEPDLGTMSSDEDDKEDTPAK